jgi:hypothetical protein
MQPAGTPTIKENQKRRTQSRRERERDTHTHTHSPASPCCRRYCRKICETLAPYFCSLIKPIFYNTGSVQSDTNISCREKRKERRQSGNRWRMRRRRRGNEEEEEEEEKKRQ